MKSYMNIKYELHNELLTQYSTIQIYLSHCQYSLIFLYFI